jgi:ribosomal protein L15E
MYKIKLMKLQEEYKELLIDYLSYNEIFYKKFGVFTGKKNSKELAKEIINRFYSNLVSLGNYLLTKDSLGATLIQRYNHELVIDFYYLLNPGGEKDKVEKFFLSVTSINESLP